METIAPDPTATDTPSVSPDEQAASADPTQSPGDVAVVVGSTSNQGGAGGPGNGGVGGADGSPSLDGGSGPNPMLALMVTTLGGLFLLFVFMRRRRGNAEPELALAGAAATATTSSPTGRSAAPAKAPKPSKPAPVTPPQPKPAAAPVAAAATAATISPLLAAKPKTDPKKDAKDKKAGAKATAVAKPAKGTERFRIGYRSVRIGDGPDEFRSTELGRLDRGDEVEILGSHEGFLQVRTPAGLTGWIPRHTITGSPIAG